MPSQILITGATGFIGRSLTRDLLGEGHAVRVLARDRRKARRLFGDEAEIVGGDLADGEALRRACAGVETVYHVAGSYRFGLKQGRELWRGNVEGAENLFQAAFAARVEKVVHLSSGGVLRRKAGSGSLLLREDDFPERPPRFSAYKFSKWHAERRALAWAGRGLPVVIASTTCPIGRGDETPTPTGRMIRDFLARRFPFYCRAGLNFLSIDDLSRGLRRAAERGRPGARYLLSGENLWLKEFLDLLARETGLPAPRACLPGWAVRLIGGAGEAIDWLAPRSTSARVCLETSLQAAQAQFFDNARTRAELEWAPTVPLRESAREAIDWFRHPARREAEALTGAPMESHVR
jgi:dihydroflavonol-4-reductase